MHVMIDRGGTTEMHPDVARHIPAIQALCREFGVARLEIFGSAVTADFDPERSDVDFLVTYPEDYDFGLWLVRFFDLERALASTLQRDVDLIMHGAPKNPRFIGEINRTKLEIYDATEHAHVA
jgi:predicted nucleotidyltransferase